MSAINNKTDGVQIRRQFEITDDPTYCTTHLINDGVAVNGNNVTVEFTGIGPATSHTCRLDHHDSFTCKSFCCNMHWLFFIATVTSIVYG